MAERTIIQGKAFRLVATYFNGTADVVQRLGTFETVEAAIEREIRRDGIADPDDFTEAVWLRSEVIANGVTLTGSGVYADEDADALADILTASEPKNMAAIGFPAAGTETSARFSFGGLFIASGGSMSGSRTEGPATFNLTLVSSGPIRIGPVASLGAGYPEAFPA